jgi:hypothetical protein
VAWKKRYLAAAKKAAIKAKASGGRDQFGAAHAATKTQSEDMHPSMGYAMEGYFDNLAAAAMNEKHTLEEMVRAIANLTESNEILTKTNAALTHQVKVLQKAKGPNNPRNPHNGANGAGRVPSKKRKLCPNCKQDVFHLPADCFELSANTAKRPNNWVTRVT